MPVLTLFENTSLQEGFSKNPLIRPLGVEMVTPYSKRESTALTAIVARDPRFLWKAHISLMSMSESPSPDMTMKGPSLKKSSTFLMAPAVPMSLVSCE
jgi:hypothetical protein